MDLRNSTVSILGAGRSGRAAALLAWNHGATVTIYDASEKARFNGLPDAIRGMSGVTAAAARGVKSDLVVISPGIETDGDFAQAFRSGAAEFIGETELGSRFYDGQIIGITGTNGKTTTTELVATFLNAAQIPALPCGNYGVPLCEVVTHGEPPTVIALELSSFQLETMTTFRADVAVWMNFAADHMDRYESLDEYRAAKAHIFDRQTADNLVVIRQGEQVPTGAGRVVTFSASEVADYSREGSTIYGPDGLKIDLATSRLRGSHNAENVMAAIAATRKFGVTREHILTALADYQPPAHRCEYIATVDGVEYINDSKATNLHALASALAAFDDPIVLIAGGKQKNLDYAPLVDLLPERVAHVITFGEIAQPLADVLSAGAKVSVVETLCEAVTSARGIAQAGQMVLLSPGTSSFDQFSGYEARGDAFRAAVQSLHPSAACGI